MENSIEDCDQEACAQLGIHAASSIAQHFCQAVHSKPATPYVLPYFDSLHGGSVSWKPITRHWSNVLSDRTKDISSYIEITKGLIDSYQTQIRPQCFHFARKNIGHHNTHTKIHLHISAHLILSEFELVLSNHLYHVVNFGAHHGNIKARPQKTYLSIGFEEFDEMQMERSLGAIHSVHEAIQALVRDIFALTELEKISICKLCNVDGMKATYSKVQVDESITTDILCNSILPTLIRIVDQCTSFLGLLVQYQSASYEMESVDEKLKYTLMISLLASLAFCSDCAFERQSKKVSLSSALNILEILPHECREELTLGYILKYNFHLPKDLKEKDATHSFFEKPILVLDDTSGKLPMTWIDHVNGVGFRSGRSLLRSVCAVAIGATTIHHSTFRNESTIAVIIGVLGEEFAANAARDHLFARLQSSLFSSDEMARSKCNNSMTRTNRKLDVTSIGKEGFHGWDKGNTLPNVSGDQDISHITSFAIIASSIRILSAFRQPQISDLVWNESRPIIYSLIDSINASCQSLGAAILIHFFIESTPTSFISSSASTTTKMHSQNEAAELLLYILGMACKTCNDAISLSMLLKARYRAFLFMDSSNNRTQRNQREAARDYLIWISRNTYCGPGGNVEDLERIRVVLIYGAHPLLHQLAQLPNACTSEIARLGMSALLPLIRWDSTNEAGRTVQYMSILCLLSLMIGAYPIMPRHGGKIMSELLACIGRLERDICIESKISMGGTITGKTISKLLLQMAEQAAVIALLLCGRQAEEVLLRVEKGSYNPGVILLCKTIRASAETTQQQRGRMHTA